MYSRITVTGTNPQNASVVQQDFWNIYLQSPTFRTILDNVSSRYPNVIIDVSTGNAYHSNPVTGAPGLIDGPKSGQDKIDPNIYRIFIDPSLQVTVQDNLTGQQRPATLEEIISHEVAHAQYPGNANNNQNIEIAVRNDTNIVRVRPALS
jgi:hypothetical protein